MHLAIGGRCGRVPTDCALGLVATRTVRTLSPSVVCRRCGRARRYGGLARLEMPSLPSWLRTYPGLSLPVSSRYSLAQLAAVLIVGCAPALRPLAVRPAVAVGRVSYGVYLWHTPVLFVLIRPLHGLSGFEFAATLVVRWSSPRHRTASLRDRSGCCCWHVRDDLYRQPRSSLSAPRERTHGPGGKARART